MNKTFAYTCSIVIGFSVFLPAVQAASIQPVCKAQQGLRLLNALNPPLAQIKAILTECDQLTPSAWQVLLLHGLYARKEAAASDKNYQTAISWLQKANAVAAQNNVIPALELAVTYEWSNQLEKARNIYGKVLLQAPHSRAALLALARIALAQYRLQDAKQIYRELLKQNPEDVEALNGLGNVALTDKDFTAAQQYFAKARSIDPANAEVAINSKHLEEASRYQLDLLGGVTRIGGFNSTNNSIGLISSLNATDSLLLNWVHNSLELKLASPTEPGFLPKNSALVGFQRQYPERYGWGVSYNYRQHTGQIGENQFAANANYYLTSKLQGFGGVQEGSPSPWHNQLYYVGLTQFTDQPWNYSGTVYWSKPETGDPSFTYVADLSKEFFNHAFYDLGGAYSPAETTWQIHGRIVLPIFKKQALEMGYERYLTNNKSTYLVAGWRKYW